MSYLFAFKVEPPVVETLTEFAFLPRFAQAHDMTVWRQFLCIMQATRLSAYHRVFESFDDNAAECIHSALIDNVYEAKATIIASHSKPVVAQLHCKL